MIYEVYVDGASRGQGTGKIGDAAAACLIYQNKKLIGQYARGLGYRTNNEAEYEAILLGLFFCWAADLKDPVIYSDSLLAVKQITSEWECNSPALVPLLASIREIQDEFRFRIIHVPRNEVANADYLVKDFLDNFQEKSRSRSKSKKKKKPRSSQQKKSP